MSELACPPRLRFITAGAVVWCATAQSMPAMTVADDVEPLQGNTLMGTIVAFFATP